IHFKLVPDFSFFIKQSIYVNYLGDIPVLTPRKEPLTQIENKIKKRMFDIVTSFLVTIFILSWLIPLLSLIILMDSAGPVFFIQQRTGSSNKRFNCIKFGI